MKKNMKIEINKDQTLNQVVNELERLGFENCTTFNSKNVKYILAFEDHRTFTDYFALHDIEIILTDATLAELKEMK